MAGLSQVAKQDLFLEEIYNILHVFSGMDYEAAMNLQIPIRKWLIKRNNKQIEKENAAQNKSSGHQDTSQPLPQAARSRYLKK